MHYLDHSATTQVHPEAAQAALRCMLHQYGNPSSLHSLGYQAKCVLEEAREIVAKSLHADPARLFFTSGGTESNNLAIFGAAEAGKRKGRKIVTTAMEHPSVLEPMKALERQGFQVDYLLPDREGRISSAQLAQAIDRDTILVSMMLVNNETGVRLPVAEAAKWIRRNQAPALLHTDAVQGFLKLPLSVKRLGADLLTVSGHKVHAPKGVGALYVAKALSLPPRTFGGGQEKHLRSGTEALPSIAAFACALQQAPALSAAWEQVEALNRRLREGLAHPPQGLPAALLHSPADALPHILNFSLGQVRAETMLHFLSQREIYVSSGSACGKSKPSHVLTAMGLPPEAIRSALRVSLDPGNRPQDVDALLAGLWAGLRQLRAG